MLSAAFDILNKEVRPHNVTVDPHPPNNTRCNPTSTGAILLADILPALFIKLTAPFLNINTSVQVAAVVLLSCSSFLMTSFTIAKWMSFLGVVCAALGSGLGEITFLAYSSHFDTDVISTWSSGTGGAGVLGAFSYAAMASVLTPETTLLVMLCVPVLLAISFWGILVHPKTDSRRPVAVAVPDEEPLLLSCSGCSEDENNTLTFVQKLKLMKFANVAFIFSEAYFLFLPSFWIVVVVVLYEGLLGGAAYVNTFYRISKDWAAALRSPSLGDQLWAVQQAREAAVRQGLDVPTWET